MKDLKDKEIHKKLAEQREKLRVFRFANALGKTKNTKEGRVIKKDIARMETEVNARKQEK